MSSKQRGKKTLKLSYKVAFSASNGPRGDWSKLVIKNQMIKNGQVVINGQVVENGQVVKNGHVAKNGQVVKNSQDCHNLVRNDQVCQIGGQD